MIEKTIPFTLFGKHGKILVSYKTTQNPDECGMDLLDGLGFDINVCIGYPMIHAQIIDFEGHGYRTDMAWIQILNIDYFDTIESTCPIKSEILVDNTPSIRNIIPFMSMGPMPQFFDAPSSALIAAKKVEFHAYTFLVSLPLPMTNNAVTCIQEFEWGYRERNYSEDHREIDIFPLQAEHTARWNEYTKLLCQTFPQFDFSNI